MRVLLSEHDLVSRSFLKRRLRQAGHNVDAVSNGEDVMHRGPFPYEVLLMSLGPGNSGLEGVQELRRRGYAGAVLLLTSSSDDADRICALDAGADDCVSRPFSFVELLARLRALKRRPPAPESQSAT